MITSGFRNIIHLLFILLLLNIVFAIYPNPSRHRQTHTLSNQRSANSNYRYAWFTRDIHDDMNNDEEQELSPQRNIRLELLRNIFNLKYPNNGETLSESYEKL